MILEVLRNWKWFFPWTRTVETESSRVCKIESSSSSAWYQVRSICTCRSTCRSLQLISLNRPPGVAIGSRSLAVSAWHVASTDRALAGSRTARRQPRPERAKPKPARFAVVMIHLWELGKKSSGGVELFPVPQVLLLKPVMGFGTRVEVLM